MSIHLRFHRTARTRAAAGYAALATWLVLAGISVVALPAHAETGRIMVAAGSNHSCAITPASGVECWGDNQLGQLGDGTALVRWTPVAVAGLTSGVAAVSAGENTTCALTTAGGVKCWGSNWAGQLGDGTASDSLIPVSVTGLTSGVAAISVGSAHACALTTAGAVKCWGANYSGQLGDGSTTDSLVPVNVSGLTSGIAAISAGGNSTCAVTVGGAAKCWGSRVGDGTSENRLTPVNVTGLTSGVASISAGSATTCAVTVGGAAKCWRNRAGDGTETARLAPVNVTGLSSGVASITAGVRHTCARTTAGGMKCWGFNLEFQLGDGTTTTRLTPVNVSGLTSGVTSMALGRDHTCALASDGTPKCWGTGSLGQVGDDTAINRPTPVNVKYVVIPSDPTPPTWTKPPTNAMPLGAQLDPAILGDCDSWNMPVTVNLQAADPQSGIHHYVAGGESGPYYSQTLSGTSTTLTAWVLDDVCGGGGSDAEFFAFNRAGLYTADFAGYWHASVLGVIQDDGFRDGVYEDVPPLIYKGTWSTSACNCFSGGTTQRTTQSAASVELSVPASYGGTHGLGLLMAKAPDRGKAAIFVDNVKVATIDTYSATKVNRTVVWRQTLASGSHTIRVVNLATPGRTRIDVDAFVLMRK
jgi:alpha-tubulin suppressor-like RCC1 family protein